jgi:hypothetical protein
MLGKKATSSGFEDGITGAPLFVELACYAENVVHAGFS